MAFALFALIQFSAITSIGWINYVQNETISDRIIQNQNGIVQINNELQKEKEKYSKLYNELEGYRQEVKKLTDKIEELETISVQATAQKQQVSDQTKSVIKSNISEKNSSSNKKRYVGNFKITYYCKENYPHICGTGNGVTASGAKATKGITVAADTNVLPMGTKIYIDGIGERIVQDRGGGIKGNRLDILVDTHTEALNSGIKTRKVWIVE